MTQFEFKWSEVASDTYSDRGCAPWICYHLLHQSFIIYPSEPSIELIRFHLICSTMSMITTLASIL